jgi:hypothetical protein
LLVGPEAGVLATKERHFLDTPGDGETIARKGIEESLKNNNKTMEKTVHQLKLNRLQICTLPTDELEV